MAVTLKLILFSLSGFLFTLALILFLVSSAKYRRYHKVPGEIVEIDTDILFDMDEKESRHYPVFSYMDTSGHEHRKRSLTSTRWPAYKVGEKVEVLYKPDDPGQAMINRFMQKYNWSIYLFWTAMLFGIAGWMAR